MKIIHSSMIVACLRERKLKLLLKWCWYKYVRRIDIMGFYDGVPIVRTNYLVEESKNVSPD